MRLAAFVSIILMLGTLAGGQTTRASVSEVVGATWERQVSSLAATVAAHDSPGLQSLVPGGCAVRRFNGPRDPDLASLVDFTSDKSVLGDHAYLYPPATAAADIARDVTSSALVSDFIKKTLAMDDQRDQAVVLRWLAQSLGAEDNMPIAVIVLWQTGPDPDDRGRPNFILIKGEKDGDGFKFGQIVYGDPLE
ncbi:MAG: hypothetical protein ABSB33_06495 [Tepidisphaeraceae bacterium]|jgi:hypothetical protein